MQEVSLTRIAFFIIIMMVWYFSILSVAIPLTLWYLYTYRAYELIGFGVIIDGYFLTSFSWPLYTLGFLGAFCIIEIIKPRLRYKQQYEI